MFSRMRSFESRVSLTSAAYASIVVEAFSRQDSAETGGVLLGYNDGPRVSVTHAGPPGPRAIHQPDFFLRDLEFAQNFASNGWAECEAQWIGEWHTHPAGVLIPSHADVKSYRQHITDPELGFEAFLSIIVQKTRTGISQCAWIITESKIYKIPIRLT